MINEQKLKLFMRMIEKNKKQSKHFSFDLSLQGNQIEGLNNKFKLLLTDHSSTKYQIGFSVVVGSIENYENFIVFGIRTGEDTIILDLVDLTNDVVYDLFVIDDFVAMNYQKRMVEIDEKMTITSKKLNYVLKKVGKEGFSGIDFEEIEKFESNVLKNDSTYSFFKKHLIKLLSSDEYMKDITNNMHKELLTMEIYKPSLNIKLERLFITNGDFDQGRTIFALL